MVEEDDDDEGNQVNPLGVMLNILGSGHHNQGNHHSQHQRNKKHKRNVQQQPGADGQDD